MIYTTRDPTRGPEGGAREHQPVREQRPKVLPIPTDNATPPPARANLLGDWAASPHSYTRPHAERWVGQRLRRSAADPHRRRRPEPARPPRRPAPRGRLRDDDRARRRRGAQPAPQRLAGPPDHRHDDAADGRPDPGPRDQGPRRLADHRPVGRRCRGLEGGSPRGSRRGLRHQALPLPGAPGADQPGAPPAGRQGPPPEPAPGPEPRPRPAPP